MNSVRRFLLSISLALSGHLLAVSAALAETSVARPETIILISLDTTRADHLSCYGYKHETTPNIDALANESLFFENPFSPIPLTLPAHSSLFTGLLPPTHGVHSNRDTGLAPSALSLAEILQQEGYATYGIVSTVVLRAAVGLDQGFDHYDDAIVKSPDYLASGVLEPERKGEETTDRALQWLSANAGKKKFMFIHYYDAHDEFTPPAPFDTKFKHPYDGEIAFTDHCVGRVIDRLKALNLYDDALIALVGDHGEMLGEHGEDYHSFFIYQNALRVPMMFKLPGGGLAKRVSDPASLVDVAPTLLSMAGLSSPKAMQGLDLSAYRKPDFSRPDRVIYGESMRPTNYNSSSLLGVVIGPWHYIQSTRPELYDRLKDPAETNNLIRKHPKQASAMKEQLKNLLVQSKAKGTASSTQLDDATLEQLRSLGYLDTNVVVDYSFKKGEKDAKDMIGVAQQVDKADKLARSGNDELALKICTEIIKEHPSIAEAHKIIASVYIRRGDLGKAESTLKRMQVLFPENWDIILKLVQVYKRINKNSDALNALESFIALRDDVDESYKELFKLYMEEVNLEKALATLDKRRGKFPDDVHTLIARGNIHRQRNELPKALATYLRAMALDPRSVPALTSVAKAYLDMANLAQALLYYEQLLVLDKNLTDHHLMVARIKLDVRDPELHDPQSALRHANMALDACNSLQEGACDMPAVFEVLAIAWGTLGNFDEARGAAEKSMELYRVKPLPAQVDKMKNMIEYFEKQQ